MPYSREALESLARALDVHQSMMWVEPSRARIEIKQLHAEYEEDAVHEA